MMRQSFLENHSNSVIPFFLTEIAPHTKIFNSDINLSTAQTRQTYGSTKFIMPENPNYQAPFDWRANGNLFLEFSTSLADGTVNPRDLILERPSFTALPTGAVAAGSATGTDYYTETANPKVPYHYTAHEECLAGSSSSMVTDFGNEGLWWNDFDNHAANNSTLAGSG